MDQDISQPLSVSIPTPDEIRCRLTAIYREAAMLRRLLRVAEQQASLDSAQPTVAAPMAGEGGPA